MKISIITICFNSASTIEDTFISVVNQTYPDIEYIVVDGKSTDGTVEIIKKYENTITKWVSEPDKGLYDAMNKGINMATGDVVGILNSDDVFFSKTTIEEVADFHKKNNLLDISVGHTVYFNEKDTIVREYSSKNWTPKKLKYGFMPSHPAVFIKRSIYKNNLYDCSYKIGSDYDMLVKLFLKGNFNWKKSNIITTKMRIGGVSSSGFNSYKVVTREIIKSLKNHNINFFPFFIHLRGVWKVFGVIKALKFWKIKR